MDVWLMQRPETSEMEMITQHVNIKPDVPLDRPEQ